MTVAFLCMLKFKHYNSTTRPLRSQLQPLQKQFHLPIARPTKQSIRKMIKERQRKVREMREERRWESPEGYYSHRTAVEDSECRLGARVW